MNLRLHISLLLVVLASQSVISAIETSATKNVGHKELSSLDDLYIDDEGDDDIQLQGEVSGSGPTGVDIDSDGEDYEFVDNDDVDEPEDDDSDDEFPFNVEEVEEKEKMEKRLEVNPIVEEKEKKKEKELEIEMEMDNEKDKEVLIDQVIDDVESITPRAIPVAVSPLYTETGAAKEYYDENEEWGSGSGASPTNDDDTNSAEDDYDEDDEDLDYGSITGETDPRVFIEDVHSRNHAEVMPTPPPATEAPPQAPKVEVAPPEPAPAPGGGTSVVEHPIAVNEPTGPKQSPEDPSHTTEREGTHRTNTTSDGVAKNGDRQASFFAQPGILAAVVGGAVVGLLCAILLVMFIVYRMRKKDEGSYALEEPKRNSPNSHPYNKNSREFYA